MSLHLLLIDDNVTIAANIREYLELEWWSVDVFHDGLEWLQQAQTHTYDCLILDVMLPGVDGFSILEEVRKKKQTPIIMTTARGQLDDKSTWFSAGADDYLVKPFELAELVMRIRALVKRSEVSDIIRRGDLEIDLETNSITKDGQKVDLTPKEWHILLMLLDANGGVVQRATIIDELRGDTWIRDSKNDAKLDVYIANLRKKLDRELIETVKSVGYKLSW